ncbi:methylated-DNA--[protein]-cysteine S-methyltransferase [Halorhabdus sp. CBA1104]|uniref:methylated-DNA--[protein]-cysteine S-methyltransferase n=1 Tax=unclassified Halorhabdus TaxID=2621901 RepID=UPI0012B3BD44|nr:MULTISPECIES: MGMT family protein [unclassified Halorhabdus]QGN07527.1 methylated-DNA--[protein]-cysteine S-methyltransferase [Halorhabdus sp. CBA1104]
MDETAGIYARDVPALDRAVQVGIASGRVISLSFPMDPPPDADQAHDVLDQIDAYLDGEAVSFRDIEVALTMATEQRDVLERVRDVPYGETITVEALARMTPGLDPDSDDARGVVRTALAENPVPLLVPDHRVRDGPSTAPPPVEQQLRVIEGLT